MSKTKQGRYAVAREFIFAITRYQAAISGTPSFANENHIEFTLLNDVDMYMPHMLESIEINLKKIKQKGTKVKFDLFSNHHGEQYTFDFDNGKRVAINHRLHGDSTISLLQF